LCKTSHPLQPAGGEERENTATLIPSELPPKAGMIVFFINYSRDNFAGSHHSYLKK